MDQIASGRIGELELFRKLLLPCGQQLAVRRELERCDTARQLESLLARLQIPDNDGALYLILRGHPGQQAAVARELPIRSSSSLTLNRTVFSRITACRQVEDFDEIAFRLLLSDDDKLLVVIRCLGTQYSDSLLQWQRGPNLVACPQVEETN